MTNLPYIITRWLGVVGFTFALGLRAADADYKLVRIESHTNAVRVRLPLTDVTGKVRVKEKTADGFGLPVAPSQTALGSEHYLEWQIGYDTPTTNSATLVPEITFTRKGETKHGHELTKIIYECVRLGLLTTNDLAKEIAALEKIPAREFEESQPVIIETATNTASDGFARAVQHLPLFTKTTPHGFVQIQLKQKQRAVGYQAMIYVCLPLDGVLDASGSSRVVGKAHTKEVVFYEFTRANAGFVLDILTAFGRASAQHNEDVRTILALVIAATKN
jgi:hypothetical protein